MSALKWICYRLAHLLLLETLFSAERPVTFFTPISPVNKSSSNQRNKIRFTWTYYIHIFLKSTLSISPKTFFYVLTRFRYFENVCELFKSLSFHNEVEFNLNDGERTCLCASGYTCEGGTCTAHAYQRLTSDSTCLAFWDRAPCVHITTHTYTHVYTYVYMYICTCLCMCGYSCGGHVHMHTKGQPQTLPTLLFETGSLIVCSLSYLDMAV